MSTFQIRTQSGEVIEVDSDEPLDAADLEALVGKADDPLVKALVAEIRRLGTVLSTPSGQRSGDVHVSPTPVTVLPAAITLNPSFNMPSPVQCKWRVEPRERDYQGKPKYYIISPET